MSDFSGLGDSMEMWVYLGFEPWEHLDSRNDSPIVMRGAARKVTLVKSSVVGVIAKYYAWDYLVWSYRDAGESIEYLLRSWKPLPDVVTQRFLLVGVPHFRRKARSFWLGFGGFLEVYAYTPGETIYHPKIKDLVPPINRAWEMEVKTSYASKKSK